MTRRQLDSYSQKSHRTRHVIPPSISHLQSIRLYTVSTIAHQQKLKSEEFYDTPPPTPPNPPTSIPSKILQASLSLVPQYGWTIDALSKGAESLGYLSVTHGMFPRGGAELIDYFLEDSRRKMTLEIKDKMEGLRVPQKIRLACVTRLNLTKPFIARWPEALAILAQPNNVPTSLMHLAKLSDEMWYLAGDKSADMNWYTKRGELAMIYSATELYMTQDNSPDFQATLAFLDRRLQDIALFGKTIHEIDTFVRFVGQSVVGVLNSKGFRIF